MKTCPTCRQTYSDESLNFCLADGSLLSSDPDATLVNATRRADPPETEVLPSGSELPRTRNSALPYVIVGLLALIVGGGAVAIYTSRTNSVPIPNSSPSQDSLTPSPTKPTTEQADTRVVSPPSTVSNSFQFSIRTTGSHFASTLPLLGGYEIGIPGDGQWYDTKILVRPSYQLQIDFWGGTQGNVNIQVGEVSGFMQNALQNGAYYEYNFVARLRNNPYDHVLAREAPLKVRSSDRNVFIKVDVRQGDLF